MSASKVEGIGRWARRGAWLGLLVAVALPLAAYMAEFGWSSEVLLIAPYDPSVVTLNRSLWSPGESVAELYGSPMSEPTRVLLVGGQKVHHPEEDPALALLPSASGGKRPIQVRTLWWGVRLAMVVLGAMTTTLLGISFIARRRTRR